MSKVRVDAFTLSLDGFAAGPKQDLQNPLGIGGTGLHQWFFPTDEFQKTHANSAGEQNLDNEFAKRAMDNLGAWILGRNMFGPVRGEWPDDTWRGWWGDEPPYHVPVFVLTHFARPSIEMKGGTTFHFVTDGIHGALRRARQAAGSKDIRIGGGVQTVRQYLEADLIDQMHLVVSPVVLGSGEHLLTGIDLLARGFKVVERVTTPQALHMVLDKGS
jgi:dihydrofolate reductase